MVYTPAPVVWQANSLPMALRSVAARHCIFCLGGGGQQLEDCPVGSATLFHDEYDRHAAHFGATYQGEDIMTARLIMGGQLTDLPTGRLLHRLEHPPVIRADWRYSEPSRFGMLKEYQRTSLGRIAFLRLVGLLADASVAQGYDHYLISLRGVLLHSLNWFPWGLAPPIDYPPSEGGPKTAEPMRLATLNLHELVIATKLLSPSSYDAMWPHGPSWLRAEGTRSPAALRRLVHANRRHVLAQQTKWKLGRLELAQLAPQAPL